MEYVANLSGGKDSLAMVLRIMAEGLPLTKVVNFDEGVNFNAVTNNVDRIERDIKAYGAELVRLKPRQPFLLTMMAQPVRGGVRFGYDWCGGRCRWMTAEKVRTINAYLATLGEFVQYVGIAADEAQRMKDECGKVYPLIEWGMTEADCLAYCRASGYHWDEDGTDLYDVLDRASCWCCGNKNLKELRAIRKHLPQYWGLLLGLQSRIDRPFRSDGATLFDLERRFADEERQASLFDED